MDYWDSSTWGETLPDGTMVVHGVPRIPLNSATQDNTSVVTPSSQYSASIGDVPGLVNDQLQSGGKWIEDHPGEILAGLAAPELGVPAAMMAGIGGYLFDSLHPFTDQPADYKTMSPEDYIVNGLASGTMNGLGGFFKAPETEMGDEGIDALKAEAKSNPLWHKAEPDNDFTGEVMQGPASAGYKPGDMVGNPATNTTTQGYKDALSRLGSPNGQPLDAYRGVSSAECLTKLDPNAIRGPNSYLDETFMSGITPDDYAKSASYMENRDPRLIKLKIQQAIEAGDPRAADLQGMVDKFDPRRPSSGSDLYHLAIDRGIIKSPAGMMQELKVFPQNPIFLNGEGKDLINLPDKFGADSKDELWPLFWEKGHDAVIIDNVIDHNTGLVKGAIKPSRVIVVNPDATNIVKSKFNTGEWNTLPGHTDIMRTIPLGLGAGLGAYKLNQQGTNQ